MEGQFVSTLQIPPDLSENDAVVIDVLRAFTTAAWVLAAGASKLVLASSDVEALQIKALMGPASVAIKDGVLSEGFDLGNSPGQVRGADLAGRNVVLRSTNGTVAVNAARRAPLVLSAALANAGATARELRARHAGRGVRHHRRSGTGRGRSRLCRPDSRSGHRLYRTD